MGISCRRAWIALALAASIGTGKERPPGEAFAAGLKKAQSQVQKRKWSSGRKLLRRLLDEHHKQPYVRARAASIADLM
ncbi:MAG: hypothetical protein OER88_00545, partial [Planctomycetota bacterium]|nr:hypothetical protein [Planctomycetota bacterium]